MRTAQVVDKENRFVITALCYCKPDADPVILNTQNSGFDFKTLI